MRWDEEFQLVPERTPDQRVEISVLQDGQQLGAFSLQYQSLAAAILLEELEDLQGLEQAPIVLESLLKSRGAARKMRLAFRVGRAGFLVDFV